MPTPLSQLDDDERIQLESIVETFAAAWNDSAMPPLIEEYFSAGSVPLQKALVVELVKVDLEQRWERGLRRLIEDYTAEFPDLADLITPSLILEEIHARKLAGDDVKLSEYVDRFPDSATSLARLIALDPGLQSLAADPMTAVEIALVPGDVIDDFDLLVVLGKGAFATVFLARQRSMQRIVAVKISADKGNEPQTLAQLEHDNIIRVYDQRSVPERGLRLLYMQYAAGGTLASVIQSIRGTTSDDWNGQHFLHTIDRILDERGESPLTESPVRRKLTEMSWPQLVCWIGAQLSRALDHAHRQGVLHRDLKPANVLLTAAGIPKLADFNISFSSNVEGTSPVSYFGGSLAYMSPEQLEACDPQHERTADSLDHRSDLYSLGVVLWELLTAERPFLDDKAESSEQSFLQQMIHRRRIGSRPPFAAVRHDGIGLQELLHRCLQPDPDHRFQAGDELAHELELCLQPEAKKLLAMPTSGWKSWVRRFPLFTVTMLTLVPNLVAAVFNFLYNHREIVEWLPSAEPTFMKIQAIINLIAFPTGIFSARWLAGSVAKATRMERPEKLSVTALAQQRRRCLELGNVAAIVGLTLWLIAAPAYPISLHLMLGDVPTVLYGHFVASLAICGLIAAAYPFFGVSIVAVRAFYPALVDRQSMTSEDRQSLQRLARQTWLHLVLAASVPMLAIVILTIGESDRRTALIVLAAGGVLGYGIAVSAFRILQSDLATLIRAMWKDEA